MKVRDFICLEKVSSLAKFRRVEVKVHIFMYSAVNLEYSFMDMFLKVRRVLRGISFFGNEAVEVV